MENFIIWIHTKSSYSKRKLAFKIINTVCFRETLLLLKQNVIIYYINKISN